MHPSNAAVAVWLLLLLPALSSAHDANKSPVMCDAEHFCPPSTSCCPTFKSKREPNIVVGYSCLMGWSSRFPRGPCCPHYEDETISKNLDVPSWRGGTGCGNGYECAVSSIGTPNCFLNSTAHPIDYDGKPIKNKYEVMPRYRACKSFTKEGVDVFGLPIPLSAALSYKRSSSLLSTDEHYIGLLAYYSNMGSISDNLVNSDIKTAIIGVHGSGRDAGTYLCALTALAVDASKERSFLSLRGQRRNLNPKDVLVVAPWFMAPSDDSPLTSSSLPYLQWDAQYPIFHTWRYGAESISDISYNNNATISSFGAMDVLLESLCDRKRFPNLQRIAVVGHSAGGQFVHRWALTSNSWCFGDGQYAHRWAPKSDLPNVRTVVANPRSFTYLDNRRYFAVADQINALEDRRSLAEDEGTLTQFNDLELRPPRASEENECNGFNKYEWGLDPDVEVPAPYVMNNVQKLIDHGDNSELFCRYASRDVVYITGQRDIEILSAENRYKGLHGDRFQGPSRRERSERFFAALQARGRELEFCGRVGGGDMHVHDRRNVKDVAHDHALMFASPEGIQAMFG